MPDMWNNNNRNRGIKMADPTVLEMINDNLKDLKLGQVQTNRCLTDIKVGQKDHDNRIQSLEKKTIFTEAMIIEHIKNKDKHYNPFYAETFGQKVKRKKGEIAVGAGGGTLLSSVVLLILKITEVI